MYGTNDIYAINKVFVESVRKQKVATPRDIYNRVHVLNEATGNSTKLQALVDTKYTSIDIENTYEEIDVKAGDVIEGEILSKNKNTIILRYYNLNPEFGWDDGNTAVLATDEWKEV